MRSHPCNTAATDPPPWPSWLTLSKPCPAPKSFSKPKITLYAEFTSQWMGFVDDVEFYLPDSPGVIHVRSASRLGESDLGVNRQRIEAIRNQLNSLENA